MTDDRDKRTKISCSDGRFHAERDWDGLRQLGIDQETNIFENIETGEQSKN